VEAERGVLEMGGLIIEPGQRIGPYVYERIIGKGGMANVVLCRSPDGRSVALKILKASRFKTGLTRFRREFRALSRIHHPNVIRVEAYGDIFNHPYIAMEYVEGRDLHQTIRAFAGLKSLDERWVECERILVDVCKALAHVHQRGLVHRDLKPSNILLSEDGRAKLTDFGIVKDLDPNADPLASRTLVGTWAYASPEQIGGQPLDHRSDLYSLGVILFAMLTSRRPFAAKDMMGYRRAHLEVAPPRASDIEPEVPAHLDEICWRLLQKAPRERFQSALEILYRLEQLEESHFEPNLETWVPPLAGRKEELDVLQDAVNGLTAKRGGVVTIHGEEGAGVSRLIDEAIAHAANIGIPVQTVRDLDKPGLVSLLELTRQVSVELGKACPETLTNALKLWAEMEAPGVDAAYQLVDALALGMVRLLKDGPRLLIFDDFHLATGRQLQLLGILSRRMVAERAPLLVLLGYRTDKSTPPLERFLTEDRMGTKAQTLHLEALNEVAIRDMLSSLIGPGKKAQLLAERLHSETEGNPAFVSQFLASLIHQGVLVAEGRRMHLAADANEIATGHLKIPPGVRQLMRARLDDLSAEELQVLQVLAVNGRRLDLDCSLEVLDKDEDEALDAFDTLITRGLIAETRTHHLVHHEIRHGLLKDLVYRDLEPQQRSELHYNLGRALEQRYGDGQAAVDQVGEHYRLAGESGKAYSYLVSAAQGLWVRGLPGQAWEISSRAMAIEDLSRADLDPVRLKELKLDLLQVRADVSYMRGEWQEGQKIVEALRDLAKELGDQKMLVDALRNLGRVHCRMEQMETAATLIEQSQKLARTIGYREGIVQALYELAVQAWGRGDLDKTEELAREGLVMAEAEGQRMAKERAELILAVTAVDGYRGNLASAAMGLLEAIDILEGLGQKQGLCVALCNLAEMTVWQGHLAKAKAHADRALEIALELDYRLGRASATRVLGEVLLEIGERDAAKLTFERALKLSRPLNLTTEMVAARYALARLAIEEDRVEETENHIKVARALAERRDPESYIPALVALHAWVCGKTGDEADARRMLKVAEASLAKLPTPRRCQVMINAAKAHQVLGDDKEALRLAAKAAGMASSRGLRLTNLEARLFLAESTIERFAADSWRGEAHLLASQIASELDAESAMTFKMRFSGLFERG
jgi:tetratricopeptide (TPR) repeat protein